DPYLTTQMKSVGAVMGIGRNFTEAFGKAPRSPADPKAPSEFNTPIGASVEQLLELVSRPFDGRAQVVMKALRAGATVEQVFEATKIDPWFLDQLAILLDVAREVRDAEELTPELLRQAKRHGLGDAQIARLRNL